jgi:tellurite resistance protein
MENEFEITYDLIKPIILEEKLDGSTMHCKFKVEGEVFESKYSVRIDSKDTSNKIKGMVKLNLISRMRSTLMRVIRSAVGGGIAGNTAAMVGNEVVRNQTSGANYSAADKQDAVVEAFERISFNFYFDQEVKAWKIARRLSEFEKRLKSNPLTVPYDKKTLARLLLELAKADGQISPEEKAFFSEFLDEDTGTFAELMRAATLSKVELEEVSKEAKENVFMIACAVTFSDKSFDEKEKAKLYEVAANMNIIDKKRDELLKLAQDYTIESAIEASGKMTREEIYTFADKIGMERSEAERAQIKFEKRQD